MDLASRGARVIIHYHRSHREASRLWRSLKGRGKACLVRGDLSDLQEVERVAQQAWEWRGRVDVLIHNASTFFPTPLGKTTAAQWEQLMAVNAQAPFFLSQSLGRQMARRGRGKIICIADWAANRPYPEYLPYCAAKAALLALAKGLARSLAPKVQVNSILPGAILWPETMKAGEKRAVLKKTPLGRLGDPQDIASAVRFFIEGSDFITGAELHVDGGRHVV